MQIIRLLNQYRILKFDANNYQHIYKQLEDTIALGGMNYDGMPHGSDKKSQAESDAIRLADAYLEYADRLNEATQYMLKIVKLIETVPDVRGRYVLFEKYIEGRSIDEISQDKIIQRCGRQARRYHDEAIEYLQRKCDENQRKDKNV